MKTLLLSMPFAPVSVPAMGLSILKARLLEEGIDCDTRYPNLYFAERAGLGDYTLVDEKLSEALLGDWLFAQHLWNDRTDPATSLAAVLQNRGNEPLQTLQRLRGQIGPYLEDCIDKFNIPAYHVIGFSTTLQQNLASLALSRLIRERYPEKVIVFGGANCQDVMGLELHRSFPWIDYVFSGESDNTFPLFLKRLAAGEPLNGIPGLIARQDGRSIRMLPAENVHDMDALPDPDFHDYFEALKSSPLGSQFKPQLLMESSRGCWWGAKHHCTFCGLNGETLTFRAKSAKRVLAEVERQVARYGVRQIVAVDTIVPHHYFRTLLPMLKERQLGVDLYYQVKSNLRRDQLQLMREARLLCVQPGIESLSSNVLKLMNKGVKAIQNIQLLKWCREFGIEAGWNLIYGFPGETAEDYAEIARNASAIPHLPPPIGVGHVRLDRFSPYFTQAARFGITDIHPFPLYKLLYPLPDDAVANLARFFENRCWISRNECPETIRDPIESWRHNKSGSLYKRYGGETAELTIVDTRPQRPQRLYPLNGLQRELYEFCEEIRSRTGISEFVKSRLGDSPDSEPWLDSFLRSMEEWQLMVREGQNYLSVALSIQGRRKQVAPRLEHDGTLVVAPEPPVAPDLQATLQHKPTGFAHTAFLIPVQDKWLLHAPLHKVGAIINPAAAHALRSGSAADGIGTLLEIVVDKPARHVAALAGEAVPSLLGIMLARGCELESGTCSPAQTNAQPARIDPRAAVAAVAWMAHMLAHRGRKLLRIRLFADELFAAPEIVEKVTLHCCHLCSQLGLTPSLEASFNGPLTESQCRFVGDHFAAAVLYLDAHLAPNIAPGTAQQANPALKALADTARRLAQTSVHLCLRVSITHDTVGQMEEIARWMCQEFRPAAISFHTPTSKDLALNASLRAPDPYEFARNYIKARLTTETLGIETLYPPAEAQACPAGTDALILSKGGRLTACFPPTEEWQSSGMQLDLGWVRANGAVELEVDAFARLRRLPPQKPRCRRCFCQWSCTGGYHVPQTHPACEAYYTDSCIQTRLIMTCLLLRRMGCNKLSDQLLADPRAMEALARFPFDVFKVEPGNLDPANLAGDPDPTSAQKTAPSRPRSLVAEG